MHQIVLTQSETFLIGDIAKLLGIIMNWLFEITSSIGIENIGLCIILFTIVVKMLMFPMTVKQQKFSKISAVMNPELQAIQTKYKGKNDQESMYKMQEETKAVYEKYGTSPTGGCLQLLIQLPIIYALFRVIQNIPAYVSSVKDIFMNIVTPLQAEAGFLEKIKPFAEAHALSKYDYTDTNRVIDLLYKFTDAEWSDLMEQFPNLTTVIAENLEHINHMNNFLGINLAEAPGFALTPALLIPILSGLSQWVSTKLMTANQPITNKSADEENTMASSMKMMNNMMPFMSAFFCITMPAGLGIYWVATSVVMIVQQIVLNFYFSRMDMEEMLMKNLEKANKKRAKKGLPPQSVSNIAKQTVKNLENAEQIKAEQQRKMEESKNRMKESTDYYNNYNTAAKPGSIAAKANMVQQYNERNEKKKK